MAKKKKQQKETTIENYYDLKSEQMDELVSALKGDVKEDEAEPITTNIAEITGEEQKAKPGSKQAEFDPYKRDKLSALPVWLKAILVKWWFSGCVFFFIGFGLSLTGLDSIVLCGVVLGLVTDIFVNPIYRFFESDKKEYDAYMMFPFPFKKYWTFFTNVLYYLVVSLCVGGLYTGINYLWDLASNTSGVVHFGVEPLLFGTFCVIVDMIFIGIKDLIVYLVKRNKRDKGEEIADV